MESVIQELFHLLNQGNIELVYPILQEINEIDQTQSNSIEIWARLYLALHENRSDEIEKLVESNTYSSDLDKVRRLIWLFFTSVEKKDISNSEEIYKTLISNNTVHSIRTDPTINELDNLFRYLFLLAEFIYFHLINNEDQLIKSVNNLDQILPIDDFYLLNGIYYNKKGVQNTEKQNFELAVKHFSTSLEYYDRLGNVEQMMKLNSNLSMSHGALKDYKEAIFFLNNARGLSLTQEISPTYYIIVFNLGYLHRESGDLIEAEEYFNEALIHYQKEQDLNIIARINMNLGIIYDMKGHIELALEYYQKSSEIYSGNNDKHGLANIQNNMGMSYQKLGKLKTAYTCFLKSYALNSDLHLESEIEKVLYNLYDIAEKLDDPEYKIYFNDLVKYENSEWALIAIAREEKRKKRVLNLAKAQSIYKRIIENTDSFPEVRVKAIFEFSEMLINEYKSSRSPDILDEIAELLKQLRLTAILQGSFWLEAQYLLLKSKLALLNVDIEEARNLIKQAQKLAESRNYSKIANIISDELDGLLMEIKKIDDTMEGNTDLVLELGLSGFSDLIHKMLRNKFSKPIDIEEDPVLLLIMRDIGLSIYTKKFGDETVVNEGLVASFIAAINSVLAETFATSGVIERIKYEDYTIILIPDDDLMFCYVMKGSSFHGKQKLDKFIKLLKEDYDFVFKHKPVLKYGKITKEFLRLVNSISKPIFDKN